MIIEFGVRRVNTLCVVSIGSAGAAAPPAAPARAEGSKPYPLEIRCTENAPAPS